MVLCTIVSAWRLNTSNSSICHRIESRPRGIIDDAGQRAVEHTLVENPAVGARMVGTGGVRKLRVAIEGTGKRGGARLIYYYRESKGRIYLILVYPKSRKTT